MKPTVASQRPTEFPACSLQCAKDHKVDCEGQRKFQDDSAPKDSLHQEPGIPKPFNEQNEQTSHGSVASAAKIQDLFVKYPQLQSQLRAIYHAFQGDHAENNISTRTRNDSSRSHAQSCHNPSNHGPNQHWTAEKGIANGLKSLQLYLETTDADSIGLHEFCKTVTKLRAAEQSNS